MFGIGAQELILLLVGALIIFGPQRLPEIASQVGKAIRDFRRMSDDLTGEFQRSFSLDEPPAANTPALPAEAGTAANTTNGISDTIAHSLRVETVPSDPDPVEGTPPVAEATASPQDLVISLAPVATKADPLAGVSLLDEPVPFVGQKTTIGEPTEPAAEPFVYPPAATDTDTPVAAEPAPVQNGIADAWDAVISTEATAAVAVAAPETAPIEAEPTPAPAEADAAPAVPEGFAYQPYTYQAAPIPYVPPVRERVDPEAEITIREKIENQTAAEAFRERRRLAHYQRGRKKD